jgi:hypothetical protein
VPKPSGERGQPNLFRLLRDDFTKPKTLIEGINPIRARGAAGGSGSTGGVGAHEQRGAQGGGIRVILLRGVP